jgi:PAS domain S-box-containing protein
VLPGDFLGPSGAEAVRLLIDERKVNFDAIAAANDEMALGALTALHERGLLVPDNIRVVGFDDLEEARYASPPLTTVRQPLYEQGRQAAEMLLALIEGEKTPENVTMSTELVIRQSCGCQVQDGVTGVRPGSRGTGRPIAVVLSSQRKRILSELEQTAGSSASSLGQGWAAHLLDAFSNQLRKKGNSDFILALDKMLRQVGESKGDVMQWSQALNALQGILHAHLAAGVDIAQVDDLIQAGQSKIMEIAQWTQAHRRLLAERRAFNFTIGISEPLMTEFDVAGLTDVVARLLPELGIKNCYLSLYENSSKNNDEVPTEWSRLILAVQENQRVALDPGGIRFPSLQLIPESIMPVDKRYSILCEPLHFRDETQLGFIVFEPLESMPGSLREALSRQISTALKGALLLQERRKYREELQQSQEKYRSLLEFNKGILEDAPIGILRLDHEMRIIYENPQLQKIIGLPPGDAHSRAMGMDIRQIPGIQQAGLVPYLEELKNGKDLLVETPFSSIYGKGTFVRVIGRQIHDEEHGIGNILLVEDITEEKKAEEALREGEERYRAVIETTGTGFVVLNEQGKVISANKIYAHMAGRKSVGEILGRYVLEWTAPHDRERSQSEIASCFETGTIRNLEIDYRHADGNILPVEINAHVTKTKHGKVMVTLCRNIQERKQAEQALAASEERYRSLAEASHDMIFIIAKDGRVEYANKFASMQFGLQPEMIVGMKIASLFSGGSIDRQLNSIAQVMESGSPAYIEAPLEFPGLEKWLGTWLVPLKNNEGKSTSIMGVSRDITDRIRVDQALKEYSERLEEMVGERTAELQEALQKAQLTDQLKSEFIANINHELRTPLTNLVLYHQMLQANPEVKTQERLDVIGREIHRLRVLIEDMLKLSRLDTGQVAFRPMPQDLNKIIRTLVNDRKTIAEERNLSLILKLQHGVPITWLDEVMIVQVLSNLLTNALNYTPAGGQVHISTRRVEDHAGKVWSVFSVEDTGPGISQEDLPHLFDRFYRGMAGHVAGVPGTGLGLAIVKQLVDRHHGRIEVGNVPDGHGAIFTVWLPVDQEHEPGLQMLS